MKTQKIRAQSLRVGDKISRGTVLSAELCNDPITGKRIVHVVTRQISGRIASKDYLPGSCMPIVERERELTNT